jgi:hypothetical protein
VRAVFGNDIEVMFKKPYEDGFHSKLLKMVDGFASKLLKIEIKYKISCLDNFGGPFYKFEPFLAKNLSYSSEWSEPKRTLHKTFSPNRM